MNPRPLGYEPSVTANSLIEELNHWSASVGDYF
jgi:hypothetical protein